MHLTGSNSKPLKTFSDFPSFRESGNSPGDFPEPDKINHFEKWSRREAKRLYKEIHPGKEVTDEEFFNKPKISEVNAGRDALTIASETKY